MKSKLLLICLVGIFLFSFTNVMGAEFDNFIKDEDKINKLQTKTNYGKYIIEDTSWYDPLGIWTKKKTKEVTLKNNSDFCGEDCFAIKEIKNFEEGSLIDDIRFYRIYEDGSQQLSNIRSYQISYWGEDGWIDYELGKIMPIGVYEIKLEGKKKPSWTYDWQVLLGGTGVWSEEWAVWGGGNIIEEVANSFTTGGSLSDRLGINITATINFTLISINKTIGSQVTKAYIYTSGGSQIGSTKTFSGNKAIFNQPLTNGLTYYIVTDSDGGNYIRNGSNLIGSSFYHFNTNNIIYQIVPSTFGESGHQPIQYIETSDGLSYITLNSPSDNHVSPANEVTFNCSAEVTGGSTLSNMTLYTNETGSWGARNSTTGLSGTTSTQTWNRTFNDGDNILWSCQACDSDGDCGFAGENRTLSIDVGLPNITIETPIGILDYGAIGNLKTLNVTFTDINLESCWYNYNGTNQTVTCSDNSTTFILEENNYNLTFYANDSVGNIDSEFIEWTYKILENNRTHNTTSYETARETFSINITANSSLTNVVLDYNGTDYTATQSGNVWSYIMDIPLANIGNNSIDWKFTYGDTINSDYTTYQNIEETIFTLCNASYTNDFLNVTFKDEADASTMNASIPTSTFEYYLGSGTVTKTYNFINNTDNNNYLLCATPDRTLHVNPYVQYKRDSDYPQRIWDAVVQDYTSTLTTQILYLLESADGIYVTIQVVNNANQLISGVDITATREIESIDTVVAFGTTGDAGTVTFWLNPDFSHTFDLTKSGYTDYSTSFIPTQTSYTITMGGVAETENSTIQGITKSILPTNSYLVNDTSYTFGFTLDSSYWDVSDYGFDLRLANGTIIDGDNTGVEGTALTKVYNVNNQTIIYLDYYWVVNDIYTNSTIYWIVQNTENTQWSIAVFFTDLNTYIDSGIYGLDNFGKNLIIFLILFLSVGIMSYKYGATSPLAISSLVFGIIFFFDVVVGLIPSIRGIDYMLTYLSALILTLSIFNEVRV